jgi:hypothetical protein
MKTALRIVMWIGIIAGGLIIVSLVMVFNSLPNVSELRQALNSKTPIAQEPQAHTIAANTLSPPSQIQQAQSHLESEATEPSTEDALKAKKKEKDIADLKSFLKRKPEDAQVCENLGNVVNLEDMGNDKNAIDKIGNSLLTEEGDSNPYAQAFRIPLLHIFNRPLMKGLFEEIIAFEDSKADPDDSLLNKIGFYGRMAAAATDVLAHKKYYENLTDHSYHLFVISQAVKKKPELANDPKVKQFCESIEAEVKSGKLTSFDEERSEVLSLLEYAGVSASDIGFDPEKRMKFDVKFDNHNFSIGMGNDQPVQRN